LKLAEIQANRKSRATLAMLKRDQDGMTYRKIGEDMGVSAARAVQLVNAGRRYVLNEQFRARFRAK
jgi:hypothetical protein